MAAENVSVGRESGIRTALDASAQAGLLGRQRRGLPLGWAPGYDGALSYHTPVPLACLRAQNCPSGLGLLGPLFRRHHGAHQRSHYLFW